MDRKNHKLTRSRIKSLKKRLPVKSLINLRFMVRRLEELCVNTINKVGNQRASLLKPTN